MKNIELIVSDLDGTLVQNEVLATKADIDMLNVLQAQDYKVIVATGRTWGTANEIAKTLGVASHTDIIICNNGAVISKASEYSPYSLKLVDLEYANELLEISNSLGLCFYAFRPDVYEAYWNGIACPSINLQKNNWESSFVHHKVKQNLVNDDISQLMIFVPEDKEKEFLEKSAAARKNLSCLKNDHEDVAFFELNNNEVSKGNALKFVANMLKVDLANAIAFGDNFNDISMFEVVGTSIAMDNASDAVKNKATGTTASVTEGGVSLYLNQMIMNMEEE